MGYRLWRAARCVTNKIYGNKSRLFSRKEHFLNIYWANFHDGKNCKLSGKISSKSTKFWLIKGQFFNVCRKSLENASLNTKAFRCDFHLSSQGFLFLIHLSLQGCFILIHLSLQGWLFLIHLSPRSCFILIHLSLQVFLFLIHLYPQGFFFLIHLSLQVFFFLFHLSLRGFFFLIHLSFQGMLFPIHLQYFCFISISVRFALLLKSSNLVLKEVSLLPKLAYFL